MMVWMDFVSFSVSVMVLFYAGLMPRCLRLGASCMAFMYACMFSSADGMGRPMVAGQVAQLQSPLPLGKL
ncbi:hypothetical protein DRW03_03530 [Corallococcus sp. H22C18031201]|nr:hypothetical protein DRW03_03530 [Corallococcus sp. H22C18031201]